MSTKLIGYEIRSGAFTDRKTGEVIEYDNRIVRFITDDGEDDNNKGYCYIEHKFKTADVEHFVGTKDVDKALDNLLFEEVTLKYVPRNGQLTCTGFFPVKS